MLVNKRRPLCARPYPSGPQVHIQPRTFSLNPQCPAVQNKGLSLKEPQALNIPQPYTILSKPTQSASRLVLLHF